MSAPSSQKRRPGTGWLLVLIFGGLILLSGFSSSLPDGLEWVAEKAGFIHHEQSALRAPLADYRLSSHLPPLLNAVISALLGIGLLAAIIFVITRWQSHQTRNQGRPK